MDSFTGTTFEADREERREIVAILIMRKKVFFMNFLVMVNSETALYIGVGHGPSHI